MTQATATPPFGTGGAADRVRPGRVTRPASPARSFVGRTSGARSGRRMSGWNSGGVGILRETGTIPLRLYASMCGNCLIALFAEVEARGQ